MRITILAVGKIKEKFYTEAAAEYQKRLNRYVRLTVIEVDDEAAPDKISAREEEMIRQKEGERLLARLPDGAYPIALAIKGKEYDSPAMAANIEALGMRGNSHICFLIGGSLGLSQEVLSHMKEEWSFSKLTFPHQLMRVILLEQLYRSFRIIKNEPYHK